MSEPGKLRIAPKGSMLSREKLEDGVREMEANQQKLADAQKQQDESKVETEKKEINKEIDKLLPDSVYSVYNDEGPISFEAFKSIYQDIWEQVKDKTHIARGFCDFRTELLGTPIRIRTFKTSEGRALQSFIPPPQDAVGNYTEFLRKQNQFRDARLLVSMMEYNGEAFGDVGILLKTKAPDDWFALPQVKQRLEWIDNLPEVMVETISGLIADITRAYRLAVRENLKNQLAPLSHS